MKTYISPELLIDACYLASETMLRITENGINPIKKFDEGKNSAILTEADIETERVLKRFFMKHLPDYNFIGEETGSSTDYLDKVVVLDPIDCTAGFIEGKDNFGTIIGLYENGINTASAESNAVREIVYVGTQKGGFERMGPEEPVKQGAIYIEAPSGTKEINDAIEKTLREKFPEHSKQDLIIVHDPNVLNKCRVFSGQYDGLFHATWSCHDIAAAPLFGRLTNTLVTDHNGNPFEPVSFEEEIKKYATEKKRVIYSLPVLIARKDVHSKLLEALAPFKKELDPIRYPSF